MTAHKKILTGIGQEAQGFYKVLVVEAATEKVVYESEWGKNLILNQGMESVAARLWCDCFTNGVAGTGAAPNTIDSVTDVASQTGTTVTSVGGTVNFTTDSSVGDMIKWDSGSEARITSITGALIVEVTPSQSVGSGQYTIYRTARVGLQTEVKRTTSYLTGAGNCETVRSGNIMQNRRTYDFSTESGNITYTEVGVAWSTSGATTVFSRIVLNTPVSLVSGQKLRLVYQLNITLTPNTTVSKNLPVGGWPVLPATTTDGAEQIQNVCISSINSSGTTTVFSGSLNVLDPAATNSTSTGRMFCVSSDSAAPSAFGSNGTRSTNVSLCSVAPTNASYTALSFQLDVSTVFGVADAVQSNIRSVLLGGRNSGGSVFPYSNNNQGLLFVFNENQTKTNTQTLTFTVRFTWSRVLA